MATDPQRDAPWVMRTYSGHSTARASNELYRTNLAKGQTGLSIAFDLPTQTGYDPDAPEAAGEVGKVGVPVAHLGHMEELLDQIPVADMNTSMTINATAAWLLGLYVAHAQDMGVGPARLAGTTQNDIVKEYLSRGTYIFPPGPSLRLTVDTIAYTVRHAPKWNPINVCSYHLQEAGATPTQEIAYTLATAIGVLDGVRTSGKIDPHELPAVVGRISFFVNSSVRFVEETCKMRAFTELWDRICRERYGVEDPKLRRFRYGVQVNSLGLTEQQPENNVQRIVLETLGVTLSKNARARAMQLPAWNEALGLPRPWDQQWSLRMQQVLAFESDVLEYGDIFEGSKVIEAKTAELADAASTELAEVEGLGGAFEAIDELKGRLVRSQAERLRRIETGEQMVVGVNCFTETTPSPLLGDGEIENILKVDHRVEAEQIADVERWRAGRDDAAVRKALDELRRVAADDGPGGNVMEATIALAHAGGTTGEWAGALREVFGEFRAPTGVSGGVGRWGDDLAPVRVRTRALAERSGRPAAPPRGQAGTRRALQRCRADRGGGARRRVRGDLPGHQADPGRDRGGRPRRGRRHRRVVHPVGLPHGAGARRARPPAGRRQHGGRRGGRHHPARRRRAAAGQGCGVGLHAQGLLLRPHHGGPGGAGRTPARRHARVRRAISRHVTGTAPSSNGPEPQALGHVVVVEGGRAAVALVAAGRDPQRSGHGVQLSRVVGQQVRPAVGAVAHGGPLAPVVDVDGQRPAQGRLRRSGMGLCHQRPLKRQGWCTGSCSSAGAGRGQASCTAATMAARTAGSGGGGSRRESEAGSTGRAAGAFVEAGVTAARCRACASAAPRAWRPGCRGCGR